MGGETGKGEKRVIKKKENIVTRMYENKLEVTDDWTSIPTLVRVFLYPCVGPFPSVGLTLTWFIWDINLALHITLYSVNSV